MTVFLSQEQKAIEVYENSEYRPDLDVKQYVAFPLRLCPLLEAIAEQVHDEWARGRLNQGWTYGPTRDDNNKRHPCLVPYNALPESEKSFDRQTAMSTIETILLAGYEIRRIPLYKRVWSWLRMS